MQHDFKTEQRGISLNLEGMPYSTDSKQNRAAAKQTLENTIHKLNQVILKSDIMLYADMETEKQLLTASSRLAEAEGLIVKGNLVEAKAIVREIKGLIDNMQFKPANVKIMHFTEDLLKQTLPQLNDPKQTIKTQIEQAVKPPAMQQHSARQIFESIKALGLTHELDAATRLLEPKQGPQMKSSAMLQEQQTKQLPVQDQEAQANLKSVLDQKLQVNLKGAQHQEQQIHRTASQHQDSPFKHKVPLQPEQLSRLQTITKAGPGKISAAIRPAIHAQWHAAV